MKFLNTKRKQAQNMQIDEKSAYDMFNYCNRIYFNNELPEIPIVLIESDKDYGEFKYNIDKDSKKIICQQISMNKMQRTKNEYMNTMIHEMIHYKVASEISPIAIDKACWYASEGNNEEYERLLECGQYAHDGKFKKIAQNINSIYGIHIHMK